MFFIVCMTLSVGRQVSQQVKLRQEALLRSASLENQLIKLLPPQFFRVHKSFIANMEEALALHSQAGGRYHLEMSDGQYIPVSRSRYPGLRQQFV